MNRSEYEGDWITEGLLAGKLPCSPEPAGKHNKVYPARVNCAVHGPSQPGYSWVGAVRCIACHCLTCAKAVARYAMTDAPGTGRFELQRAWCRNCGEAIFRRPAISQAWSHVETRSLLCDPASPLAEPRDEPVSGDAL